MANEITMETMQLRLKEIINKEAYPDKDGGIEMYLDYRDTLEESTLHEIMKADNPREHFEELLSDWTLDGSLYYEDGLAETIKKKLTEDETEFFEENKDEVWDWIRDNYYFYYDAEHYNETIKVNIMLDVGNCNYDFTRDNILNYCNYYSDNGKDLKNSSIMWLAKQQKKATLLRKAINTFKPGCYENGKWIGRTENKDLFIESVIQELENLPSHMATLTFLVNMPLFDYFDLREAIAAEKELNNSYVLEDRKGTGTITISKDTMCGLFDPWSGGGSSLEIELDKDVVLPIKCIFTAEIETGKSEYGYSVDDVYGLIESAWNGTIKETHYMKPKDIEKIKKEIRKEVA